jgi:dihydrodipicolinate reductase
MQFLILGKGKTGSLVADVARERGHAVRALDIDDNQHASALTAANLNSVDAVIDFTAPEAAVENMRAVLALGSRIVVGTTGWYAHLDEMKSPSPKPITLTSSTHPPAPPSPCARSSRRFDRAARSPSPPTARETPRVNT